MRNVGSALSISLCGHQSTQFFAAIDGQLFRRAHGLDRLGNRIPALVVPFQQLVGRIMINKPFLGGIETQLHVASLMGDVADVHKRRTFVAKLDVGVRSPARFDGIHKILLVRCITLTVSRYRSF
jgi:hypothetical protein